MRIPDRIAATCPIIRDRTPFTLRHEAEAGTIKPATASACYCGRDLADARRSPFPASTHFRLMAGAGGLVFA